MPDSIRAGFFELKGKLNDIVRAFGDLSRDPEGSVPPALKILASYADQELGLIQTFMEATVSVRAPQPRVISIEHYCAPFETQEFFFLADFVGGERPNELQDVPPVYRLVADRIERDFTFGNSEGEVTFSWTAQYAWEAETGTKHRLVSPRPRPEDLPAILPRAVGHESWEEIHVLSEGVRKLEDDCRRFGVEAGGGIEPSWLQLVLDLMRSADGVIRTIENFTRETIPPPLTVEIIERGIPENLISLPATWSLDHGEYRFQNSPIHLRFILKEIEDILTWRRSWAVTFNWKERTIDQYNQWLRAKNAEECNRSAGRIGEL